MQIMRLMEDIHPLALESTPAVLSVGKRCMEEGWTFIWNPWNPLLISPSGKRIHLKVHGNVPYLVENKTYAMPADAYVPGILPAGDCAAHHEEVRLPQESVGGELLERTDVRNLKAEAKSLRHLMINFPKNPHCSACMRATSVQRMRLCESTTLTKLPVSRSRRITSSLRMLWTNVYLGVTRH